MKEASLPQRCKAREIPAEKEGAAWAYRRDALAFRQRMLQRIYARRMFCSNSYKFEIRLSITPRYSSIQPRYVFEEVKS